MNYNNVLLVDFSLVFIGTFFLVIKWVVGMYYTITDNYHSVYIQILRQKMVNTGKIMSEILNLKYINLKYKKKRDMNALFRSLLNWFAYSFQLYNRFWDHFKASDLTITALDVSDMSTLIHWILPYLYLNHQRKSATPECR